MSSDAETINLLDYLRSKTQVDCDCLDVQAAKRLGPFVDCTSNQADAYYELKEAHRQDLLRDSFIFAKTNQSFFTDTGFEQLAAEVAMVKLSLTMAPLITGLIHVMVNPALSYSEVQILNNANRLRRLCSVLDPSFDLSKLCIKVPATWEGMQACRQLANSGFKTLATTLHSMEQAVLAAEAGCIYVSPFVHELQTFFDDSFRDPDPIIHLCPQIQQYYSQHGYSTQVKACCLTSVDEAVQIAGVNALTIGPSLVQALLEAEPKPSEELSFRTLFGEKTEAKCQPDDRKLPKMSFIANEAAFRAAYAKSNNGRGKVKTEDAITLFGEYQAKLETLVGSVAEGKY